MPRTKRTVGFWRGSALPSKAALMPAVDRWTGTLVDAWPDGLRKGLRHELLAVRRARPDVTEAQLVSHANAWLGAYHAAAPHPAPRKKTKKRAIGGRPASVDARHVRLLLSPPAKRTRSPATDPETPRTDGAGHHDARGPTALSAEEFAEVIRRNKAAVARKPAKRSSSSPQAKKKRRTPPASKAQRRTRRPPRPNGLPRVEMRAGLSPRGPYVIWPSAVLGAVRVRLDVTDLDGSPVCKVKAQLADRYAILRAPSGGFRVRGRFLDAYGKTLAEGHAEFRST